MADSFKFLQQNRPDIGLVDRFDLSEIYDSDERLALANLLLNPDGLDQIYGLGKKGLTKEDIRTMGGLDRSVIHSLAISNRTLGSVSLYLSQQITTDKAIGEPGKHSFSTPGLSDNVLVFQGGLAAKKIEYNFLDENGEVRTTTVPTSRESLFNSSKNADGQFTSASYPSLFRIRRRSHLYELRLAPKLLIEKGSIIESPTDTLNIPTYMKTTSNAAPSVVNLQCYSTKNSPLILPVRISNSATISFSRKSFTSTSSPFVYGFELKRRSDLRVARAVVIDSKGVGNVSIVINTAGTVCNGVDSLLYVYLDPAAVTGAELPGIGLTEQAGKDIGLVGFNALETLNLSGNNLSTLPVWLKTLHGSLISLNIDGNTFWNNGIVSYFDWQTPPTGVSGGSQGDGVPIITLAQVLGYSGFSTSGSIVAYDGTYATAQDSAGVLYKEQRKLSAAGSALPATDLDNGFRPFTVLRELNLGSTVRLANPDFSSLFPNIDTLNINTGGSSPRVLFGLVPKLKNNGRPMSLGLSGHTGNAGGSIRYLGDTITYTSGATSAQKDQFIGQFKFASFNISNDGGGGWWGGICTTDAELGVSIPSTTVDGLPKYSFVGSGTAAEAWSGFLAETQYLNLYYRDFAFRIANGTSLTWAKLGGAICHYHGLYETPNKVKYNANVGVGTFSSTDILQAPLLGSIESYYAGWYGKLFSIAGAPSLTYINMGANNWEGYTTSDGKEYLLPSNFAFPATATSFQKLNTLYLHYLLNSSSRNLEFDTNDLKNLPKISTFYVGGSHITGKFPTIFSASNTDGVVFNTWFESCRFRDLSALGSINTGRVGSIYGPSNGTGVGGSLLPNFATLIPNTTLNYVNLDSTLSSEYPDNWYEVGNRRKLIAPLVTGAVDETTPSVTWASRNNNNTAAETSDKLYHSGGLQINSQVMVGDVVIFGTAELGRVSQIDRDNTFIYITEKASVPSGSTLKFRRAGQNIGGFFDNHFDLHQVYLQSTRSTGPIPQFKNCTNVGYVNLNNNLLSQYTTGTLKNITGMASGGNTTPKLRRFILEGNVLSAQAIKSIINEAHEIAVYYRQKGISPNFIIGLFSTKYNSSAKEYQNWTRAEIFNQSSTTINAAGDTITIPDPLETKFQQLGAGNSYPGITIQLF